MYPDFRGRRRSVAGTGEALSVLEGTLIRQVSELLGMEQNRCSHGSTCHLGTNNGHLRTNKERGGHIVRKLPKLLVALLTPGLMAVLLPAASSATSVARPMSQATTSIKFGFLNLADSVPYALTVEQGVLKVAAKDHVTVVTCNGNLDAATTIACAEAFKVEGVQGIANYQGLGTGVAERTCAAGPKVPVLAVDIPQPPCQDAFFGANNYVVGDVAGVYMGQYAKAHFNCKIDGLIDINTPVNALLIQREDGQLAGFRQYCPNAPKVTNVEPTSNTTPDTIAPMTATLSRFPGATRLIVFGDNDDTAIGAVKAAQSVGRLNDIYVSGQGGDSTSFPYICGDTPFKNWIMDTGYFPEDYGNGIVPLMIKMIEHKPYPKNTDITHLPLTKADIQKYYPSACK